MIDYQVEPYSLSKKLENYKNHDRPIPTSLKEIGSFNFTIFPENAKSLITPTSPFFVLAIPLSIRKSGAPPRYKHPLSEASMTVVPLLTRENVDSLSSSETVIFRFRLDKDIV